MQLFRFCPSGARVSDADLTYAVAYALAVGKNLAFKMASVRDGRRRADTGIPAGYARLRHHR